MECEGLNCESQNAEYVGSDHEIGGEVRYYWFCRECQAEMEA